MSKSCNGCKISQIGFNQLLLHYSDFVQFLNNYYGNCYTFITHEPNKSRQYIQRGGTDEGSTLSISRSPEVAEAQYLSWLSYTVAWVRFPTMLAKVSGKRDSAAMLAAKRLANITQ